MICIDRMFPTLRELQGRSSTPSRIFHSFHCKTEKENDITENTYFFPQVKHTYLQDKRARHIKDSQSQSLSSNLDVRHLC